MNLNNTYSSLPYISQKWVSSNRTAYNGWQCHKYQFQNHSFWTIIVFLADLKSHWSDTFEMISQKFLTNGIIVIKQKTMKLQKLCFSRPFCLTFSMQPTAWIFGKQMADAINGKSEVEDQSGHSHWLKLWILVASISHLGPTIPAYISHRMGTWNALGCKQSSLSLCVDSGITFNYTTFNLS